MRESGAWPSAANLVQHSRNMAFYGFSQRVRTNSSGASLLSYLVLDTDGLTWPLVPTHSLDLEAGMVRALGRPIHWAGGAQPSPDPSCWFSSHTICSGGLHTHTHTHSAVEVCMHACTHTHTLT